MQVFEEKTNFLRTLGDNPVSVEILAIVDDLVYGVKRPTTGPAGFRLLARAIAAADSSSDQGKESLRQALDYCFWVILDGTEETPGLEQVRSLLVKALNAVKSPADIACGREHIARLTMDALTGKRKISRAQLEALVELLGSQTGRAAIGPYLDDLLVILAGELKAAVDERLAVSESSDVDADVDKQAHQVSYQKTQYLESVLKVVVTVSNQYQHNLRSKFKPLFTQTDQADLPLQTKDIDPLLPYLNVNWRVEQTIYINLYMLLLSRKFSGESRALASIGLVLVLLYCGNTVESSSAIYNVFETVKESGLEETLWFIKAILSQADTTTLSCKVDAKHDNPLEEKQSILESIVTYLMDKPLLLVSPFQHRLYIDTIESLAVQLSCDKVLARKVFPAFLEFLWQYWEHEGRDVRRRCRGSAEAIFRLYDRLAASSENAFDSTQLLLPILDRIVDASAGDKGKYAMLAVLVPRLGVDTILQRKPQLFDELIEYTSSDEFRHPAIAALESLLTAASKTLDSQSWISLWLPHLVKTLERHTRGESGPEFLDNITIPRIIDSCPRNTGDIVQLLAENSMVELWASFVRYGLSRRYLKVQDLNMDNGLLEQAAMHAFDYVRVQALAILNVKSAMGIDSDNLSIFITLLENSVDFATTAHRTVFVRNAVEFMHRIPSGECVSEINQIVDLLINQSRLDDMDTSLAALKILNKIIPTLQDRRNEIFTHMVDVIHTSSFELCRVEASRILTSYFDQDVISDGVTALGEELVGHALTMERMRGALLVSLVVNKLDLKELISKVEDQIHAVRADAVTALMNKKPLHGVLAVLEHAIHRIELGPSDAKLIAALLHVCIQSLQVGLDFFKETQISLGDDMHDFAGGENDEEENDDDIGSRSIRGITVCAIWRSIKVASQVLVRLMTRALNNSWLDCDQLCEFCCASQQVFTELLIEVRHWGVASWVQQGYSELCVAIAKTSDRKLHMLPKQWLKETLVLTGRVIQERHDERYSGLSRCVIAAIAGCASLPGVSLHEPMQTVLSELFPLCAGSSTRTEMVFSPENMPNNNVRVNALNMVRWLVEDRRLGPHVPYQEVLLTSLDALGDDCHYVRNAAQQLFCAAVLKIFGDSRAQGTTDGIPANEFLDYQKSRLRTKLLDILSSIAELDSLASHLSPTLYPTLLLITRLRTTLTDSFHDFVSRLAHILRTCRIAQVRDMTARALLVLVPVDKWTELVRSWWMGAPDNEQVARGCISNMVGQNELHSLLILSTHVLTTLKKLNNHDIDSLTKSISDRSWISNSRYNGCNYTRAHYFRLLECFPVTSLSEILPLLHSEPSRRDISSCLVDQQRTRLRIVASVRSNPSAFKVETLERALKGNEDELLGALNGLKETREILNEQHHTEKVIQILASWVTNHALTVETREIIRVMLMTILDFLDKDETLKLNPEISVALMASLLRMIQSDHIESVVRGLALTLSTSSLASLNIQDTETKALVSQWVDEWCRSVDAELPEVSIRAIVRLPSTMIVRDASEHDSYPLFSDEMSNRVLRKLIKLLEFSPNDIQLLKFATRCVDASSEIIYCSQVVTKKLTMHQNIRVQV